MAGPASGRTITSDRIEVLRDTSGHRRLVATAPVASGDEILPLIGTVRKAPTRFSIQIGPAEHLDGMGPIDATNHSCEPSAFVDFSDLDRIVLRARRDLSAGEQISIHYCATEYDMEAPFRCDCGSESCLGLIRGYRHLPDEIDGELLPWLRPGLRALSWTLPGAPVLDAS